jgi:coenzyme F420-0:L-glutamate ligase/coenzyme F420-1:gamma-L-glutamate ligase
VDLPRPDSTRPATGAAQRMTVLALAGVPLVHPGDDLVGIILDAVAASGDALADGDVLVLAQKIVSKAEGRIVDLATVTPSAEALKLAAETGKDVRLVHLVLQEAVEVVRHRPGVLVVEHKCGAVLANAGIDASNVEPGAAAGERVLLLPEDPDASCARLRDELRARTGVAVGVVMNDSLGRAWRNGTVGAALGAAGIAALKDLNGRPDLFDRPLKATQIGLADELAAAASLVMGQADEGRPVVLIRGMPYALEDGRARDLVRDRALDMFR